ncbi:MAG: pseudouridine synthase [Bacteroidales bacterium]|nr:pseudouridine synthase [Candidatus Egerieousia equi]
MFAGLESLESFDEEKPRSRRPRREESDEERPRTRRTPRRDDSGEERPRARRSFRSGNEGEEKPRTRRAPRRDDSSEERPRARRSFRNGNEGEERPRTRRAPRREDSGEERPRVRRSFRSSNDGEVRKPRTRRTFENEEESQAIRKPRTRRTFKNEEPEEKPVVARKKRTSDEDVERLNKFISNSGVCSRREADEYIKAGLVSVNGVIVTELGTKVKMGDDVRFNGERLRGEEKVYILMNKPKDFATTVSDPHADKTVLQLIENKVSARVYPVGRLDKATTGVLLITNDGDLADKLTHPSYEKKKIYQVTLDRNFKANDFSVLLEGITLEDGPIAADDLSYVGEDKSVVGVEIHSGRNRIVRRMFEHLGYKVKKLDRVYFAGLTKKNLRRGAWRFLTEQEITMLKMNSYK